MSSVQQDHNQTRTHPLQNFALLLHIERTSHLDFRVNTKSLITLDISKLFNMAWHAVVNRRPSHDMSSKFCEWISNCFSNRRGSVAAGNIPSLELMLVYFIDR